MSNAKLSKTQEKAINLIAEWYITAYRGYGERLPIAERTLKVLVNAGFITNTTPFISFDYKLGVGITDMFFNWMLENKAELIAETKANRIKKYNDRINDFNADVEMVWLGKDYYQALRQELYPIGK